MGPIAPIRNIAGIRTDVGSSDVANAPCVVVSRSRGSVGISLLCASCVVAWLPIERADDHIGGLERGLRAGDVDRVGASEFLYCHGATESLQADLRRRGGDGKNALIYVHRHAVEQHELLVGGERLLRQNVRLCALEGAEVAEDHVHLLTVRVEGHTVGNINRCAFKRVTAVPAPHLGGLHPFSPSGHRVDGQSDVLHVLVHMGDNFMVVMHRCPDAVHGLSFIGARHYSGGSQDDEGTPSQITHRQDDISGVSWYHAYRVIQVNPTR